MSVKNSNQKQGQTGMSNLTHGLMLRQDVSAVAGAFPKELKKHVTGEEQHWEEIEGIYQDLAHGIVDVGYSVNMMINVPGVRESIENKSELKIYIDGLTRDLTNFADQAAIIHNRHAGRAGVISQAEFRESLEIFEQYVQLDTQFKAVTLPTVLSISDAVGNAVHNMNASLSAEEAKAETPVVSDSEQATTVQQG